MVGDSLQHDNCRPTPTPMNRDQPLDFSTHGAKRFRGAVKAQLNDLDDALGVLPRDEAGTRIHDIETLDPFLANAGCVGSVAASLIGSEARPVRALLFNKTPETNWSLAWHQDRTICVKAKCDARGFGNWTRKRGFLHVEPPFDLLTRMATLRVHLDDVPATNAPLLIAPGSHVRGRIPVEKIGQTVQTCGTEACLAEAGDIWAYSTPILHASEAAQRPASRRVLQIDYAAEDLPAGLEWLGV